MDSNTNLELGQGSGSGRLVAAPQQQPKGGEGGDDAITPVKSQVTLVGDDGIEHMTLNTVTHDAPGGDARVVPQKGVLEPAVSKPVTSPPKPTMPGNYVVALEKLGESPDFVDCPWCKKRQKTKVVHTDSSQTTLAAMFCCLCCGVITAVIPFCFHWFGDTEHICGGCNHCVARRPHDGKMEAVRPQPRNEPRYRPSQFEPMTMQAKENLDPKTNHG